MKLVPAIGSIGNQRTTHRAGIKENRAGVPRDVARVVAFLASEEAGYVTGQSMISTPTSSTCT